jgi:transposase InsO family protein
MLNTLTVQETVRLTMAFRHGFRSLRSLQPCSATPPIRNKRPFPRCYGPELTSRHFLAWCVKRQIELVHIQPEKPTQNAQVESFHGRLREECLAVSWFQNLFDARRKITAWKTEYNEQRPHSSLGYLTPNEFATAMRAAEVGSALLATPPSAANPEVEPVV